MHNLHAPADGRQAAFELIGVNRLAHLLRHLRVQAAQCLRDAFDGESPPENAGSAIRPALRNANIPVRWPRTERDRR